MLKINNFFKEKIKVSDFKKRVKDFKKPILVISWGYMDEKNIKIVEKVIFLFVFNITYNFTHKNYILLHFVASIHISF